MLFPGSGYDGMDSSKILNGILLFIVLFMGIVIVFTFIVFGLDSDYWEGSEKDKVEIIDTGQNVAEIDLADLEGREGTNDYTGEIFDGYDDPKQVAMARELLEIYREVITKEGTVLAKLSKEVGEKQAMDLLMETLIGIHAAEGSTYSRWHVRKSWGDRAGYAENGTYILSNFVSWNQYAKEKTVDGKPMTFKTYNYKDFNNQFLKENPNRTYTTSTNSDLYNAGYWSVYQRSGSGALGPMQCTPRWWKQGKYFQGNAKYSFVNDPIKYVEGNEDWKYTEKYSGKNPDIWNFQDQVNYTLHQEIKAQIENGPAATAGIPLKDFYKYQSHIYTGFNRGKPGHNGDIEGKHDAWYKMIDKIYLDETLEKKLFDNYKASKGHGDGQKIIFAYYKANNFGNNNIRYGGIKKGKENAEYITKAYYEGKAWYQFLQGIAYGANANPNTPEGNTTGGGTAGVNKVRYNYMTPDAPRRNKGLVASNLDNRTAIGYKGPYPLFAQNSWVDYNNHNYMASSPLTSGCTVYAAISGMLGTGELPNFQKGWDTNGDGVISFLEMYAWTRTGGGARPHNLKVGAGGSTNPRGIVQSGGYKIDTFSQNKSNKSKFLGYVKQGYPTHFRVAGNLSSIKYIGPKETFSNIDYLKFDMDNLDLYDTSKEKSGTLAATGHSMIAVGYKQINGKDYVSIVDSSYHHSAYDSNLCWWNVDDIMRTNYDGGRSYAILGSASGETPKPIVEGTHNAGVTGGGGGSGTVINDTGVEPREALKTLGGVEMNLVNNAMEYDISSNKSTTVTIKGGYQTAPIPKKPYESESSGIIIYTGKTGNDINAVEIKGLTMDNIRTNKSSGSREVTELFDIKPGQTFKGRAGYIRGRDKELIYEPIEDIN